MPKTATQTVTKTKSSVSAKVTSKPKAQTAASIKTKDLDVAEAKVTIQKADKKTPKVKAVLLEKSEAKEKQIIKEKPTAKEKPSTKNKPISTEKVAPKPKAVADKENPVMKGKEIKKATKKQPAKSTESKDESEKEPKKPAEAKPVVNKRGTKRSKEQDSENEQQETDDVVAPLPTINGSKKVANGVSGQHASDTEETESRAVKRVRRGTTPSGPLNSPPKPIDSVRVGDINDGRAVEVTYGIVPTSTDGDVLPRKLFVWGSGDAGQFGVGSPSNDPNKLNRPKPFGNKQISVEIDDGELGVGGIEVIVGGGMHSIMIDANGRVLTSGAEDYGTLGRRHRGPSDGTEDCYYSFAPLEGLSPTGKGVIPGQASPGGTEGSVEKFRATRAAAGDAINVILDDQGRLRAWGHFKDGEGRVCFADSDADGSNREQWHPIALPGLENELFSQIACGENHVLALSLNGKVYSWGVNTCYQLGRAVNPRKLSERFADGEPPRDAHLTPVIITGLSECKRIFCGLSNAFVVEKSGRVLGWGLNTRGQTGTGSKQSKIATPLRIASLSPARHQGAEVVQIVGGNFHTAFLLSNGEVYICGDSDEGKLGLSADHPALKDQQLPTVVKEPVHVAFPDPPEWAPNSAKTEDGKTKIVALSAGMRFTLALAADGTLYSWGTTSDDAMGQPAEEEGGNQSKETPTPIALPGKPGAWRVMAASTAGQHSLALAVKPPQDD